MTVIIYTFINAWNEFLAALIFMTEQDKFTLPVLLSNVQSGLFGLDWGALQAGVTIAILPCAILFLLLQRYYPARADERGHERMTVAPVEGTWSGQYNTN